MSISTSDILNHISAIHTYSLAAYLRWTAPYFAPEQQEERDTLDVIIADQERTVDKIGAIIIDMREVVIGGEFPLDYTSYHDLGFDYLLGKLIENETEIIEKVTKCVNALPEDSEFRAVAEEVLGNDKAHLQMLQELQDGAATS